MVVQPEEAASCGIFHSMEDNWEATLAAARKKAAYANHCVKAHLLDPNLSPTLNQPPNPILCLCPGLPSCTDLLTMT